MEKTTRTLRKYIREAIDGEAEVSLSELAEKALHHFSEDSVFLQRFFQEHAYQIIYELTRTVVKETRSHVVMGDTVLDREGVKERARRSRWSTWLEHVGDKHMVLPEMTREELLVAARERDGRAEHEAHLARFFRGLADKLEGGQVVKDLFTLEEIDEMFHRASKEEQKKRRRVA